MHFGIEEHIYHHHLCSIILKKACNQSYIWVYFMVGPYNWQYNHVIYHFGLELIKIICYNRPGGGHIMVTRQPPRTIFCTHFRKGMVCVCAFTICGHLCNAWRFFHLLNCHVLLLCNCCFYVLFSCPLFFASTPPFENCSLLMFILINHTAVQ
jgi:hypothetical protein